MTRTGEEARTLTPFGDSRERCDDNSWRVRDLRNRDDHTGASAGVGQKRMPWRYGSHATVTRADFSGLKTHWLKLSDNWKFDIGAASAFDTAKEVDEPIGTGRHNPSGIRQHRAGVHSILRS